MFHVKQSLNLWFWAMGGALLGGLDPVGLSEVDRKLRASLTPRLWLRVW